MIKFIKLLLFPLFVSSLLSFGGFDVENEYSLLFVGNSLTYSNNLPERVKTLAKQKGIKLSIEVLALPNYALEDHWNDGKVQSKISSNKYDFVIIQQGPSSQSDGRAMLIEYGAKFSKLCANHNTKLMFYMVWPAIINYQTFDDVIKNYIEAAQLSNAILCPVGVKWKEYIDKTKDYTYYGTDGFHPSTRGSEIAAEVILCTIQENI